MVGAWVCPLFGPAAQALGHTLADVVRWMATVTADLVGLAQKGRIATGADADLVRFAPDERFTVDVAKLHHRNPVSAYAGRSLTGVIRETWLRVVPVDNGTPWGRLLRKG